MAKPMAGNVAPSCKVTMQTNPKLRRYFGALLSIGLSVLFLYLATRQTDLLEVQRALAAMDLRWLLPIIIISLVDFWLRAVRWAWMFPPNARPKVRQTFSVFMIGTMTNNILPGRLGDIVRAGIIGRLVPLLGTSGAIATVMLEKVADGLMLLAFLGVTLLVAPMPAWLGETGGVGSLVFLGSLLVLLVINGHGKADRTSADSSAERSSFRKMFAAIQRLVQRFALGLNVLDSKKQTVVVLIVTLAIWLLEFSIMFVVFLMFALNLPFVAAIVTGVILSMGMMIPAAPGAIGTYQFFTVTALQLYQVPESEALALAVFLNLFVLATSTLLGLLVLSAEGVNWVSAWRPLKILQPISNRRR